MQFHKKPQFEAPSPGHGHGNGHGHTHVVHQMPTYNFYGERPEWFRYPNGNSVYYTMNGYGGSYRPIEYVPTTVRTYSTREMDILSRVYLGGVGLVGMLILYNLLDKK